MCGVVAGSVACRLHAGLGKAENNHVGTTFHSLLSAAARGIKQGAEFDAPHVELNGSCPATLLVRAHVGPWGHLWDAPPLLHAQPSLDVVLLSLFLPTFLWLL